MSYTTGQDAFVAPGLAVAYASQTYSSQSNFVASSSVATSVVSDGAPPGGYIVYVVQQDPQGASAYPDEAYGQPSYSFPAAAPVQPAPEASTSTQNMHFMDVEPIDYGSTSFQMSRKAKNNLINTILIVSLLIGSILILMSFWFSPMSTNGGGSLDWAWPVAALGILLFMFCVKSLHLLCAKCGQTAALSCYYCATCISVLLLPAVFAYAFWSDTVREPVFWIRITMLLLFTVFACFISLCVYLTNVTARYWSSTRTYWTDGTTTTNTSVTDFGFVKLRHWGCAN